MTRNRLALIGLIALALAAFVSMSIYKVLNGVVRAGRGTALTTVVAAANDVPAGTMLNGSDLRLVKMQHSDLPPGSFSAIADVVGRAVMVPLMKGSPVVAGQLAAANAGSGLPALIPSGMRAVSVKVNDVISVAGFVTAGTRVDVVLTGQPKQSGSDDPAATTVLENIQVLAAGQKLQHNAQGDPQQVSVITLLVTPEDAQKLALATQEGKIQLALRNPLDDEKTTMSSIRNTDLFAGVQKHAAEPKPARRVVPVVAHKPVAPPHPEQYTVELIKGPTRVDTKFDQQKDAQGPQKDAD
jgi:pilus assembly protein CpaB